MTESQIGDAGKMLYTVAAGVDSQFHDEISLSVDEGASASIETDINSTIEAFHAFEESEENSEKVPCEAEACKSPLFSSFIYLRPNRLGRLCSKDNIGGNSYDGAKGEISENQAATMSPSLPLQARASFRRSSTSPASIKCCSR